MRILDNINDFFGDVLDAVFGRYFPILIFVVSIVVVFLMVYHVMKGDAVT